MGSSLRTFSLDKRRPLRVFAVPGESLDDFRLLAGVRGYPVIDFLVLIILLRSSKVSVSDSFSRSRRALRPLTILTEPPNATLAAFKH